MRTCACVRACLGLWVRQGLILAPCVMMTWNFVLGCRDSFLSPSFSWVVFINCRPTLNVLRIMQGESRKECLRTLCVYMRAASAGHWQFGDSKTVEPWPHGWAATRGELSYLAPLGSENISAPYFKQCFFPGGGRYYPPRLSRTPRLPVPRQVYSYVYKRKKTKCKYLFN